MRTCEEFQMLISALIDDEISTEDRVALMEHLEQCESCKAYLDDQFAIHDALHAMECAAPVGFADGVMARVRETKQERTKSKVIAFPGIRRFAGLAACCALIMFGMFALSEPLHTMENSAESNMAMDLYADCGAPQATAEDRMIDNGSGQWSAGYTGMPAAGDTNGTTSEVAFAACLTTGSSVAERWVNENLGAMWAYGESYYLTGDQYAALRDALVRSDEAFTESVGSAESNVYLLIAG